MKGAIIGDIIGSVYENHNIDTKEFPLFSRWSRFTDDTVMTCATAKALLNPDHDIVEIFLELGHKYPNAGYGGKFRKWLFSDNHQPYGSFGNGSAMRVSPVGLLAKDVDEAKLLSAKVTAITHNHPEGMKGAECTAVCMVLAKLGASKEEIKKYVEGNYYVLDKTCNEYRKEHVWHGRTTCQISMPQALECFFESDYYEDCIRNCISIGGDSDTIAAIAGGIAETYYGIPDTLWNQAKRYLPDDLLCIVEEFYAAKEKGI